MRIAFLTERARGSGAAEAAWNLALSLQQDGYDIAYLYAESSGPAEAAFTGATEIGRWQLPNREIRTMKQSEPGTRSWLDAHLRRRANLTQLRAATLDALATFEPDVVHLHNIAAIGGHTLASSIARRWPTVWTAHDRFPFELFHNSWEMHGETSTTWEYSPGPRPARTGLEMFLQLPVSVRFLTPSRWLADIAEPHLAGSVHRVSVLSNLIPRDDEPIDTAADGPPVAAPSIADALGLDAVALAVIPNPGYPLKGFDTVRQALAVANARLEGRGFGLAVTTDQRLGLEDEGIFTTPELFERGLVRQSGYLDKAGMAALYRATDVVTIASWVENMPNVAIEAAAAGRPVIASRVGGIPELVRPGETGWLVDAGDHEAMGDALLAAADPETRRELGATARSHYEQHHHPEVVCRDHLELYRRSRESWRGDPDTRFRPGLDLGDSRFRPPRVPVPPRPPRTWRRYAGAVKRRLRRALSHARAWYHRRLASRP